MCNEENTVEHEERIVSIIETINFGFGNRKINSIEPGTIILGDNKITIYRYPNNMRHILTQDVINAISLLTNELNDANSFLQQSDFKSIVYDFLRDAVKNEYTSRKMIECFILTLRQFLEGGCSEVYLFEDHRLISIEFI